MENLLFDSHTTLEEAAYTAACVAGDMHHIHVHAIGEDFDAIHDIANEYYNAANIDLDNLMEFAMECGGDVKNVNNAASYIGWDSVSDTEFTYDAAVEAMFAILVKYLLCLCSLGELPAHVKSHIDEIVEYWSKEAYYKTLRRMPKAEEPVAVEAAVVEEPAIVVVAAEQFPTV